MKITHRRLVVPVTVIALGGIGVLPTQAASTATAVTSVADADAILIGETEGGRAGFDVAAVGDLNGDGIEDLAVGAPFGDHGSGTSAGAFHLLYGPVHGTVRLSDTATIVGTEPGDFVGEDVSGVGDIDGDGYDDLLVGAPGSIPGFQPGRPRPGVAYLFYGGAERLRGTFPVTDADAQLVGTHSPDFAGFGAPPGPVGDLDGDGTDDLVVGSAGWGAETGSVYVIYGRTERMSGTVPLAGADAHLVGLPGDFAGLPVAGAGDLDRDGAEDLVVGAPGDITSQTALGSAYVVYGGQRLSGTLPLASSGEQLVGEVPGDRAGRGAAGAGDVNGDGSDDIIVGANARGLADTGRPGYAYIVYGGRVRLAGPKSLGGSDAKLTGEAPNDQTGRAVAGGRDVNGDGLDDVLVGAPLHDSGGGNAKDAGSVYLIHGNQDATSGVISEAAAVKFIGAAEGDRAGSGVALGDFDGDGVGDTLIGAEYADIGATDAGATYLFYGRREQQARGRTVEPIAAPTETAGRAAALHATAESAVLPATGNNSTVLIGLLVLVTVGMFGRAIKAR